MDELIERLNDAWRKLYGDGDEHDVCDTLAEAAAALEAAREDAERYRWLRDPLSGAERVIFYCRGDYGKGLMAGSMLDAAIDDAMRNPSFCRRLGLSNTGRTLRQVIDQALGKGGQEVGDG